MSTTRTDPWPVDRTHAAPSVPPPATTTETARSYLASIGSEIRPVTVKRYLARGWRWYAPSAGQMLTDADLLTVAANERQLRSTTTDGA